MVVSIDQAIAGRSSCPRLQEPAPTEAQLQALLGAAVRAPDHGLLRPWRFLPLTGVQREQLGDMMLASCLAEQPDLSEAQQLKLRQAPLRAPMVLVVVAEVQLQHKVSVIDQIMACAAAVQNLLLQAHALGIGAMWRTGAAALSATLKQQLGFQDKDEIVGFIYLGRSPGVARQLPNPPPVTDFIRSLPQ